MNVRDWNANKCLAHFCHALKVLRGHPSTNWQHAPLLVHRQPPSHRWVLWACDSWRLISRQPAAVQIHAWMFSSPAPPATVVLEAPLPNGCYKHIISNEPRPVAAGHFTGYTQNEAQAPCATALLPAGQPSLRCSHPRSLCSLFP